MRKILFVLILLLLPSICVADESEQVIEKKKAAIIKIMSQGQFKAYIEDDKKFCAAFLDDFAKQKGIEHIKPIVEVDDYNDLKLQNYLKQCPNKKFNKATVVYPNPHYSERWVELEQKLGRPLTDEELEDCCGGIAFYATKNFKLYKVNIDNDARGTNEYVLYAEGFYSDVLNQYTYGGYTIIDLNECKFKGGVSTQDPYDYKKEQPIENYNGIIKYNGEYYVFELNDFAGGMLALEKYNKKRKNMSIICRYYKKTFAK
jgi:competence protein ComGC